MARLDYDDAAPAYARGRPIGRDAIAAYRQALAPYLRGLGPGPLVDVGAGTGWFATALADWFDLRIVAVEPALGMRRQAATAPGDARVAFVGGTADALPLRDHSAGGAWLSTVIHHFDDLESAARELARVLAPESRVFIRSAFPERLERIALFRFFAAARRVAATFPTVAMTLDAFALAGFLHERTLAVPQVSAPSLAAAAEQVRVMRYADSTLRPLTDAEFAAGLAALEAAAAAEPPAPVVDHLDLLVLRLAADDRRSPSGAVS